MSLDKEVKKLNDLKYDDKKIDIENAIENVNNDDHIETDTEIEIANELEDNNNIIISDRKAPRKMSLDSNE